MADISYIESKGILSKLRGRDTMFGLSYSMNLYRGCQHGCIYCDTRSDCYGIGDISKIAVKKNAIELLAKALRAKRAKGTIGTGSMNDPYMPLEASERMTRRALEVIAGAGFPVHVITKGALVERDTDLLTDISRTYAAVSFTITAAYDQMSRMLEPHASLTSARLRAMEKLAAAGIYTGVTMMPLLPYLTDTENNVTEIIRRAADAGASYIIPALGLTMRAGSRDYLYDALDRDHPGLRECYQKMYGDKYVCDSPNARRLYELFKTETARLGLKSRMKFYTPPTDGQLSMF